MSVVDTEDVVAPVGLPTPDRMPVAAEAAEVPSIPGAPTLTVTEVPVEEPQENELDRLDPIPEEVTLTTGVTLKLLPLKSRQFFKLLRIVTRGGAAILPNLQLSADATAPEFMQQMLALIVFSIPEAEQATLEFVYSMVEPVGVESMDKAERDKAYSQMAVELDNPELEDLFTIVGAIVRRESGDIQALAKRLRSLLDSASRSGQLTPTPTTDS